MMRNTLAIILAASLFMAGCHSNKPLEQPPQGVHVETIQPASSVSDGAAFLGRGDALCAGSAGVSYPRIRYFA